MCFTKPITRRGIVIRLSRIPARNLAENIQRHFRCRQAQSGTRHKAEQEHNPQWFICRITGCVHQCGLCYFFNIATLLTITQSAHVSHALACICNIARIFDPTMIAVIIALLPAVSISLSLYLVDTGACEKLRYGRIGLM